MLKLVSCTRELVRLKDTAATEVLCVKAMIRLYFDGVQNLFCHGCTSYGAYAAQHWVVEVWYVSMSTVEWHSNDASYESGK
jgi:hypothetical protein